MPHTEETNEIHWDIVVLIFKNRVILQELGITLGIPFGMLLIVLALSTGGSFFDNQTTIFAAVFFGLFLAVSFLFVLLVMGRYPVSYVLDDSGISYTPQDKQEKRKRLVNTLAIVFGLLSGKPSVAGAGLLANTRQKMFLPWSKIKKIKKYPRSYTLVIYAKPAGKMGVFCTPKNYPEISAILEKHIK